MSHRITNHNSDSKNKSLNEKNRVTVFTIVSDAEVQAKWESVYKLTNAATADVETSKFTGLPISTIKAARFYWPIRSNVGLTKKVVDRLATKIGYKPTKFHIFNPITRNWKTVNNKLAVTLAKSNGYTLVAKAK